MDPATVTVVTGLLVALLKPAALAAATYAGAKLGAWIHRKTKVDDQAQYDSVIGKAIALGEQAKHTYLKATGQRLESSKVLGIAEAWAKRELVKLGFKAASVDGAVDAIEAALGARRADGP